MLHLTWKNWWINLTKIESQYIWVVDENGFGGEVLLDDYLNYLKSKSGVKIDND